MGLTINGLRLQFSLMDRQWQIVDAEKCVVHTENLFALAIAWMKLQPGCGRKRVRLTRQIRDRKIPSNDAFKFREGKNSE